MCETLDYKFRKFFGCGLGLVASNGLPIRKPWKMATDCEVLVEKLDPELNPCTHAEHQPCVGQHARDSALYPPKLAENILESFAEQAAIDSRNDKAGKTKAASSRVVQSREDESDNDSCPELCSESDSDDDIRSHTKPTNERKLFNLLSHALSKVAAKFDDKQKRSRRERKKVVSAPSVERGSDQSTAAANEHREKVDDHCL